MSTVPGEELLPQIELVDEDGEPLETAWHRTAMDLLIDLVEHHNRGRDDFYAGGNMFIYFSEEAVFNRDFRGPDFFFVKHVRHAPLRRYWVVWREGGRYPDVIIELMSPTTAVIDRTTKKDLYEQVFRTSDYFCYDPAARKLEGWRLVEGHYEPIPPNEKGWLWSNQLQLWLGTWEGPYRGHRAVWLRFFDAAGEFVPTHAEAAQLQADVERERSEEVLRLAEAERQRAEEAKRLADAERQRAEGERQRAEEAQRLAEAERQRADALAAELARLKAQLAGDEGAPPDAPYGYSTRGGRERGRYASTSLTTSPWTSVRRMSRPPKRNVSRLWSMPRQCSMVACRSWISTLFCTTL
jgi:Uma2 family endonuclease